MNSENGESLAGKINLRELKGPIARASLYIGPDSRPMHIAASTSGACGRSLPKKSMLSAFLSSELFI